MAEGLGRMISLALRFSSHLPPHARIKEIVHQLSHIGGAQTYGFGKERVRSLPDAVSKVLAIHYNLNSKVSDQPLSTSLTNGNGSNGNGNGNGEHHDVPVLPEQSEVHEHPEVLAQQPHLF